MLAPGLTVVSYIVRKKKTIIGAFLVPMGIFLWFVAPYMRSDSLHFSVLIGLVGYSVVFFIGFIMTLVGAGLILLDNNMWGS